MKKKFAADLLLLTMLLGLVGCGSSTVDMPAEVTIDGYTVILGETTMQDLKDQGYEVFFNSSQDTAKKLTNTYAFAIE